MKKIFYSVLAASMLFACSQEEIVDVTKGEGQQVTFKVELPANVASRTVDGVVIGAGTQADQLIYAMYEHGKGNVLVSDVVTDDNDGANDGAFTVTVPMAKDVKYDLLFLAYNPASSAFAIASDPKETKLTELTFNATQTPNVDAYDAFVGSLKENGVNDTKTVTLKRPFAQINAATTLKDLQDAETLGATVIKSNLVIEGVPTTYNVLSEEAAGSQKVIYGATPTPILVRDNVQPGEYSNETITVDNKEYYYLTLAYVLAGKNSSTHDATFQFFREGDQVVSTLEIPNLPIQRNYRTNVVGSLVTKLGNYTISIDAEFKTPDHNDMTVVQKAVVANESDLVEAIQAIANDTQNSPEKTLYVIEMNGDITFGGNSSSTYSRAAAADCITIPAGKSVKIDLKGHNITGTDNATGSFGLINLAAGSNLSIINSDETEGGKITLKANNDRKWNAYSSVISNQRATLAVGANVVVEHLGGTAMAYGIDNLTNTGAEHAKTTIEGATIKSTYRAIRQFLNSSAAGVNNELYVNSGTIEGTNKSIWMQDANTSANPGKLIVSAEAALKGDVYLTVTAGSTEWPVEVSIAAAALKDTTQVLSTNVPYDYKVVENDGIWTVQLKDAVVKIGEKGYTSLQKAVNNANANDVITFVSDIEQADGVLITDKNLTIDLNNKTFTVSEGANTNNRNFKINGSSVVTIKNGTMIAQGELTSGAYGTVRTEGTANATLENVKMYSYRGYGLNVKANTGSTININNSEIYAQYSGGVEAAGGTINLNNVKIDQKGIYSDATWCSVAIGVNGGGKVTIGSGNYSASAISTDNNAAQGTWVAYVMSSGGTLEINGGTFNGTVAETAAAANACGIICADRAAVVNINGGTFNSNGAILDMRNNVGTLPNPIATLAGGTFSADPRVSGLYSSNLITVKDGCKVVEANGVWTVEVDPVAMIGSTEYATLQEAFNVGGEITLLRDVTIAETVVLAEGKTAVLDLNGKTLAAKDMNTIKNNGGNLTIKNGTVTRTGDVVGYSVNNASGEITVEDATVERGLYTSGSKMTATNANISHEQSSRHAIYAWNCEVTINSGTFHNNNAGNATLMASGSSVVTINGGTFSIADGRSSLGWTSSMIDQNSTAQVLVKGGLFNGGFRINSADTKLTIEGGEFNTNNGSAFTDYSGTKVVKGGKFTDAGAQNWAKKYIAEGYEMNANGEVVAK